MRLTEHACAKVNLTLRILGRRPDGFHALESLVAFAEAAADVLTLDTTREPDVTVTGPFAGALGHDGNLVAAAMLAVTEAFPGAQLGHVSLEKNLPVAAGIGGGSADAAATLRLLRRANPLAQPDDDTWAAIAASLGSDVPVCVAQRLTVMTGRGEILTRVPQTTLPSAVLVNPRAPVPANKTAAVFKALAAPPVQTDAGPHQSQDLSLEAWAAIPNDLEPAARRVMPVIDDVLAALHAQTGARLVRLSGAGPTCFALFNSLEAAQQAATSIALSRTSWWVAASPLR
jgi:4-diphosphocytidyl-2-C-methyl-D-erythritol kinase